jgi:diguanylate cyclase (GGDEF)-like protein
MLLDLRREAWDKAEQTSKNLLQVIESDIARNVEIIDLSLRAVVDNLKAPGVAEASPELRQLVLFDRATTARDLGVLLVLDENGDIVAEAAVWPPRKGNNADREYFRVHKERAGLDMYVGRPVVSRLTGERMLNFSRRIDKPDGSFGGVVVGTIKLAYFSSLFERLGLGRGGAINLYRTDGTRIMRHPFVDADIGANIAEAPTFRRFASTPSGSFTGTSVRDGVERYYAFTQVGDLPLVLNVALATDEIEAGWRAKALVVGAVLLLLCVLTMALSLLLGRELRHRAEMQSELSRMSRTDALTSLANRRRFDEVLATAWDSARRTGKTLSLLVVDADHFKRFNDRYGHTVGDEVLKGLARCLALSVHRPDDLVARVGGEEFAVLLPDTDADGALRIAAKVHDAVATLAVASAGIGAGAITVSVGLAAGPGVPGDQPDTLYRAADEALYAAKEGGRNRTRCAAPTGGSPQSLRLVGHRRPGAARSAAP